MKITLLPSTAPPPDCFRCHNPATSHITKSSNRKGNAGRLYYKCVPCNKFLSFADDRGDDPRNPQCECGYASKRQVSGPEKGRKIHFVCKTGSCEFYSLAVSKEGDAIVLPDSELLVGIMARLKII